MAVTQARGSNQIMDTTIPLSKLVSDFLGGSDWNITNGNNDATITGLPTPVNPTDVATKNYVDVLVDKSLKQPEAYDPTVTSQYPTTYAGQPIQAGDSFRITTAGVMGTVTVNPEDLLIALVDGAGASVDTDWMVAESNRDQATETVKGVSRIATQIEADTGSDDTLMITPLKLATYLTNAGISAGQAQNGLNMFGNFVELGGPLIRDTTLTVTQSSKALHINTTFSSGSGGTVKFFFGDYGGSTITGTDYYANNIVTTFSNYFEVSADNTSGGDIRKLTIDSTNGIVLNGTGGREGAKYSADYSANYVPRSIPDVGYVTTQINNVTKNVPHYGEAPAVTDGSAVLPALANLGTNGVLDVRVYLNGSRQNVGAGNDYTIDLVTGVITFNAPLSAGDVVLVDYKESN